jgi:hypothetical protein
VTPVTAPPGHHLTTHLGHMEREEDATPVEPVVFFEAETETEREVSQVTAVIKANQAAEALKPVKVKVIPPFRIVHDGKPYAGGQTLTAPAQAANHWLRNKWVALVAAPSKSAPQEGEN